MVKPEETLLPLSLLKEKFPDFKWSSQASGIEIPDEIDMELEKIWYEIKGYYL